MLVFFFFLSEIYVAGFIVFLLLFTTFFIHYRRVRVYLDIARFVIYLCFFICLVVLLFVLSTPPVSLSFDFGLRFDFWVWISKIFIIFFSVVYLVFIFNNRATVSFVHIEYLVVFLSFVFSSFVLVSSNDFLLLFLSLDLQTICVFVLIAYNSSSMKSTEAAWKYFVLNGFASSLIILGVVFFFFISNTISFIDFRFFFSTFSSTDGSDLFFLWFAVICFVLGFLIKIGLAPFHNWLVDVFDGVSEIVLPIPAIISKIGQFSIFFYFILTYLSTFPFLMNFCFVFGILSILFSALQIMFQVKIKRQIALLSVYSSGIVFMFFSSSFLFSWALGFLYLFVSSYLLFLYVYLCTLAVDLSTGRTILNNLFNLALLSKNNFILAVLILIIFVSILGLPPLVGFFPKFFLLYCLSSSFFYMYLVLFLVQTLLMVAFIVYLVKEMFFVIVDSRFVETIAVKSFSSQNLLFFLFNLAITLFLLFFGVSILGSALLLV